MLNQSKAVLMRPSVAMFERFERSGGVASAFMYLLLAAIVAGLIAGLFALFYPTLSPLAQFVTRFLRVLISFGIFTGAVYLIGRNFFRGTGTYAEVAYTFALFYVPLAILNTILSVIPLLGWLAGIIISALLVFFGWVAVQSSTNIRDQQKAAITLLLSGIAYWLVSIIVLPLIFNGLFLQGTFR